MPIDAQLLQQALSIPLAKDVESSPIVTAVVLQDPANAADLVPSLEDAESVRATNARRILCLFEAAAVPYLCSALRTAGINARSEGIEILWAMMIGEGASTVRRMFTDAFSDIVLLLNDRRPIPDTMPAYVERDFRGRICDALYLVLRLLVEPDADLSDFRALDDDERDKVIAQFINRGPGMVVG